jgi:pseudouridine synthase
VAERLQKLISQAGIASRRTAEDLIRQQRVTVNGRIAKLGDKADLAHDTVMVDQVRLEAPPGYVYYLLNKPPGVVCTNKRVEHDDRPIVRDLVPHKGHLFTVGRLDADSEGLILLTNDGDLANRLMHPRYQHTKTYRVLVEGHPTLKTIEAWRNGVVIDDQRTAPAKVRVLNERPDDTWLQFVLREGRKRQIRRMTAIMGHETKRIIRIKIEMLELGHLKPGEWRALSPAEVRQFKQDRSPNSPR